MTLRGRASLTLTLTQRNTLIFSVPASVSRSITAVLPSMATPAANVHCGQPSSAAVMGPVEQLSASGGPGSQGQWTRDGECLSIYVCMQNRFRDQTYRWPAFRRATCPPSLSSPGARISSPRQVVAAPGQCAAPSRRGSHGRHL